MHDHPVAVRAAIFRIEKRSDNRLGYFATDACLLICFLRGGFMRRFPGFDMAFRQSPPSVATATDKKDLLLPFGRSTKAERAISYIRLRLLRGLATVIAITGR